MNVTESGILFGFRAKKMFDPKLSSHSHSGWISDSSPGPDENTAMHKYERLYRSATEKIPEENVDKNGKMALRKMRSFAV